MMTQTAAGACNRYSSLLSTALVIMAMALAMPRAEAREAEIYTGLVSGTAVGGFDPVAYFKAGKPVPGKADLTYRWKGVTWRFSTPENRDAFVKSPEAYAPKYGGYCAYAVSQGGTAKGDPKVWKIVGGKLYLNLSASVQRLWEKDIPGFIAKADTNWPSVLGK